VDDGVAADLAPYRDELHRHCYRMLGSAHDADDAVQDTMLRAWRARDRFDPGRASLRTWLHRIATNVCLTALEGRDRCPLPSSVGPVFDDPEAPFAPGVEVPWLEPLPGETELRLAVVAALQLLPARQRAVLLLREVLDLPAADVAATLDTTTAAVNSALQRARARLAEQAVDIHEQAEPVEGQRAVVDRYVSAFARADVAGLTALLADEVVLEMPPMWNWYRGPAHFAAFMRRVYRTRGSVWTTTPIAANAQLGFVARLDGRVHTVQLLDVAGGRVRRMTVYQDPAVFEIFGARAMS
jgi:RNA polymerase sigma-70 factor (ECF subfamily)